MGWGAKRLRSLQVSHRLERTVALETDRDGAGPPETWPPIDRLGLLAMLRVAYLVARVAQPIAHRVAGIRRPVLQGRAVRAPDGLLGTALYFATELLCVTHEQASGYRAGGSSALGASIVACWRAIRNDIHDRACRIATIDINASREWVPGGIDHWSDSSSVRRSTRSRHLRVRGGVIALR
jgi:hypothetical protein